jgi:membrane-bound lytic murein transglycosylase D
MPNDKFYGLKRTAYVDERFDPEKSTRAYARYMKFIYNQLGDWYLSMAAYDHGTGNIQKEVERTGYADFWELYKRNNLPTETKNYVPEILAAIIIANNPLKYGFDDITLDAPVLTDTVTINYSTDLRLVSDITQAPMEEMMALNPSLLRRITPPDAPFDLHLPAGTAALFEKEMARIPEAKRIAWRYRRVHDGDTLAAVAREYHVSQSELADANQLEDSAALTGIDALVVPTAPAAAPATAALMYTSRKGDTLVTIADKFGVSLDQLRHWNKLTGYKIEPGRRLRVGEAVTAPRLPRSHRHGSSASTSKTKTSKMSSTSETAAPSSEAKSTTKTGKTSTSKKHRSASSASGSKSTSKSDSKPATAAKKPSSTSKTKSTTHKKQSTKSKTTTTKN